MRTAIFYTGLFSLIFAAIFLVLLMAWSIWINQGFSLAFTPLPIAFALCIYTYRKIAPPADTGVYHSSHAVIFCVVIGAVIAALTFALPRLVWPVRG